MSVRPRILFSLLLALPLVAARSEAHCPVVTIFCQGDQHQAKDPQDQLMCSDGQGSTSAASYNLTAGTLEAHAATANGSAGTDINAADDYVVTGVPNGTPLVFRARLAVTLHACGSSFSSGVASASIGEGANLDAGGASNGPDPGCVANDDTLEITLNHLAGETFHLDLHAGANGHQGSLGDAHAQLLFADLPPDAVVTSCYGFRQTDFPTHSMRTSWGGIKSHYR